MLPISIRYQVFISSTFEDLRKERQQTTQAILEMGCFPSGMELFPASDLSAWKLIQTVIDESDYYVVVVAGRYGSIGPDGVSFTEMEYDYAVSLGKSVLGFVRSSPEEIPAKFAEQDSDKKTKLEMFRRKVLSRSCSKFETPEGLGMAVMKSLVSEVRINPQTGWVRADQAKSLEDREREDELRAGLSEAEKIIKKLERQIRDKSVLPKSLPKESLAQGDDLLTFRVRFRNEAKEMISRELNVSWNDILGIIGPSIYGYVVRRTREGYSGPHKYPFETNLEEYLRFRLLDEVGDRKMYLGGDQIDACIFQFKELGYLEFKEIEEKGGEVFRGITLTALGERELAKIKTTMRAADEWG